jgi:hypothetical protein
VEPSSCTLTNETFGKGTGVEGVEGPRAIIQFEVGNSRWKLLVSMGELE